MKADPTLSDPNLVILRRLGLQLHPIMEKSRVLYNIVSGEGKGSTVTIESMLDKGYRVEVVK